MSEDNSLGPAPEPEIEDGEPNPGGADAVEFPDGAEASSEEGEESPAPVMRDLDPNSNPAVEDALPDEMKQGEDTSTQATKSDDGDDEDVEADKESPA